MARGTIFEYQLLGGANIGEGCCFYSLLVGLLEASAVRYRMLDHMALLLGLIPQDSSHVLIKGASALTLWSIW